jgi:hypothetical protein
MRFLSDINPMKGLFYSLSIGHISLLYLTTVLLSFSGNEQEDDYDLRALFLRELLYRLNLYFH